MTQNDKITFPKLSGQTWLLVVFLFVYIVYGIKAEVHFFDSHPLPDSLLGDYKIYKTALKEALAGESPYQRGYRYPPPALLIIDFFYHIPEPYLQIAFYTAVNIALLLLIAYGVAWYYRIDVLSMWYWFPLALFFGPTLEQMHMGQINVITMFGIFLMFFAASSYPILAGLGLSVAVITKVTPAVFFLYLFVDKKYRAIGYTVLFLVILSALSWLRYGFEPFPAYVGTFADILDNFPTSANAQSLVSKLVRNDLLPDSLQIDPAPVQRGLNFYFMGVFLLSALAAWLTKQKEPLFIILCMGGMLAPNLIWYHHYVFYLLPLFVWMAWSGMNKYVAAWSLFGLFIAQVDRWSLTTGLLIHLFGHISILALLAWQWMKFFRERTPAQTKAAA